MTDTTDTSAELEITPEFHRAEQLICAGKNVFIHGRPGTGKSSFIKYIKQKHFPNSQFWYARAAVLTPTGISALTVQGQTAFSCLQINPHNYEEPLKKTDLTSLQRRLSTISTFIIDEISMVRADLLDAINYRLQQVFKNTKPFGGRQIILVGDFYQLPPVVTDDPDDWQTLRFKQMYGKEHPFCFFSTNFAAGQFQPVEFTHIFRQGKDLEFIRHLNAVREEDPEHLTEALAFFNQRLTPNPPKNATVLCPRNWEAEALNFQRLNELEGETLRVQANIDKKTNWNNTSGLPPKILLLKKGAFVMLLKNRTVDTYMNGTTGVITDIRVEQGEVSCISVQTDNGTFEIARHTWQKMKMNERNEQVPNPDTFYTQFPIRLAWALTIHKSQGITLTRGCIDLGRRGAWEAGQVYVALSRIRSIDGLFLKTPLLEADVITNPQVKQFNELLQRYQQAE